MSSTSRAAHVGVIAALLRERGIDPLPLIAAAGLPSISDPEVLVPTANIGVLGTLAGQALGQSAFGLVVGERGGVVAMAPLVAMAAQSPDMRSAIQVIAETLRRYRRGLLVRLDEQGATTLVEMFVREPQMPGARFVNDANMALGVVVLRALAGRRMKLVEARFSYSRPADTRPHARLFAAPLVFEAEESGLVLETALLDQPLDLSDPGLRAVLERPHAGMAPEPPLDLADRVYQMLRAEVAWRGAGQETVAERLGLGVRALHRHLAAEGTSFAAIRNRLRHERACHLLRLTAMSMAQIAQALDYSEASAFTRAFRREAGCSPSEWRRRDGAVRE